MEQLKVMEYESRKASSHVLKPRNIYYIYIYIYILHGHSRQRSQVCYKMSVISYIYLVAQNPLVNPYPANVENKVSS